MESKLRRNGGQTEGCGCLCVSERGQDGAEPELNSLNCCSQAGMQFIEFPNHWQTCFSSRHNNFARRLPAALAALMWLLLAFGESHLRDMRVRLKPLNIKHQGWWELCIHVPACFWFCPIYDDITLSSQTTDTWKGSANRNRSNESVHKAAVLCQGGWGWNKDNMTDGNLDRKTKKTLCCLCHDKENNWRSVRSESHQCYPPPPTHPSRPPFRSSPSSTQHLSASPPIKDGHIGGWWVVFRR